MGILDDIADVFGGTGVGPDPELDPDGVYARPTPLNPVGDQDSDGLSNQFEVDHGTNPRIADTDGDGLRDGDEVNVYHTNPSAPDSDHDGLRDGDEVNRYHTNPNDADSDHDGEGDFDEVNMLHPTPSTGPSPFGDQPTPPAAEIDRTTFDLFSHTATDDDEYVPQGTNHPHGVAADTGAASDGPHDQLFGDGATFHAVQQDLATQPDGDSAGTEDAGQMAEPPTHYVLTDAVGVALPDPDPEPSPDAEPHADLAAVHDLAGPASHLAAELDPSGG